MKIILLAAAFVAAAPVAMAQAPAGAGAQLQQIPPAPSAPRSIPEIRIEGREAPAAGIAAPGEKILVQALSITGETQIPEAELVTAAGFVAGSSLDLAELRAMAAKISAYYNQRGYFVAQAYLPAQDVNNGVVTIAVVEGSYDAIQLRNQTNLSDRLAGQLMSGLERGDIVAGAPLQRRLLLLSDLPGVEVKSSLVPGGTVGTSDLIVDILPGPRLNGSLEVDNGGNYYTGEWRGGGSISLNNPTGHGDVATLRLLTAGEGLNYARASYQTHIGKATVGVAYAWLGYRLGQEFEPLDATGTAQIASVYGSYPLIRSYDNNLYVLAGYDRKTLQDEVGVVGAVTDKTVGVFGAGLSGDSHDGVLGGGWNSYSAYWSFGDLDIETPEVRAIDAATARTNGGYHRLAFQASRLQTVSGPLSLYAEVNGQVASKNLDASEKMGLGGLYGVRAYPEGEGYGDEGYVASVEARFQVAAWEQRMPGRLQLVGFVDTGSVTINKEPWAAGDNRRSLSGAGVGVTWASERNLLVKVSYAHRLGDEPATAAPDRSDRVWLQVSKFF